MLLIVLQEIGILSTQPKTSAKTTLDIIGSLDAKGKTSEKKDIPDVKPNASGKAGYPDAHCKHREKTVENKATGMPDAMHSASGITRNFRRIPHASAKPHRKIMVN